MLSIEGGEDVMAAAFATMTSKGQVTIPKQVRKQLHLKPHDRIVVIAEEDRAILTPLHGTILGLKGILHRKGMKPIDFKKLRAEAEKGMAEEALERAEIRKRPPR